MKARQVFAGLVVAVLVAWTLISCNLSGGVSIKDRVSNLQNDMNTSSRSNVYNNFHPTESLSYAALRGDPSTFNVAYPPPGASFSLSVVDDSNPSAVIVSASSGNSIWGLATPFWIELQMDTTSGNDYRIVKMYDSDHNGGYVIRFQ